MEATRENRAFEPGRLPVRNEHMACLGTETVRVEVLDPASQVPAAAARQLGIWLESAIRQTGESGEVRVRLVDDAEMATAHERYAGVAGTTDVLTFDMRDEDWGGGYDEFELIAKLVRGAVAATAPPRPDEGRR